MAAADADLIQRIRSRNEDAWRAFIAKFEGRLQAFVFSRLGDRALAEDLVQEIFLGFLTALPNYDERTPLETFLFAIAAHKITDTLRRQGRRPNFLQEHESRLDSADQHPGSGRVASSLARSRERRDRAETIISGRLATLIEQWMARGEFERLKCVELLFVRSLPNREVADILGISEQDVANHKQFVVSKLKAEIPHDADLSDL